MLFGARVPVWYTRVSRELIIHTQRAGPLADSQGVLKPWPVSVLLLTVVHKHLPNTQHMHSPASSEQVARTQGVMIADLHSFAARMQISLNDMN